MSQRTSAPLGSDSWSNEPRYQGAYRSRLDFVLGKVSELAIQRLASSLRLGMNCTVSGNYAAGDFNLVQKITFGDDMQWIMRIRLPPVSYFKSGEPQEWGNDIKCTKRDLEALKSELVTMNERSSIPIPKVHAYSLLHDNSIGFPYLIMDYIHATTAYHLSAEAGNPMTVPKQHIDHYYNQISKFMLELASFKFERIGSLTDNMSSDTIDEVEIGLIAETGEGPYETTQEFYSKYPASLVKTLYSGSTAPDSGGSEVIRRLPALFEASGTPSSPPYGLVNLEMGTHNVLVNTSFDILAVIDWDSVITAPRAVLHQFPWCIGGDPGIPGIGPVEAFGDWDGRLVMCRRFANILERAADAEVTEVTNRSFSAVEFFSREALAFRALAFFRVKVNWVDKEWIPGLNWMQRCSDGELFDWYGMEEKANLEGVHIKP